jgi:ferredoxin
MYCQNNVFAKVTPATPGNFFSIKKMELCDGCKKCWEECPSGYIVGE